MEECLLVFSIQYDEGWLASSMSIYLSVALALTGTLWVLADLCRKDPKVKSGEASAEAIFLFSSFFSNISSTLPTPTPTFQVEGLVK